jgi:ribosomal protein S18 acetylase RimI-like enzyme
VSAVFATLLLVSLALSAAVAFASARLRRRLAWGLVGALLLVWLSLGLSLFGIVDRTSGAILTRLSARRPQHVESAAGGALTLLLSLGGPALLVTALGAWAIRSAHFVPKEKGAPRGPVPRLLPVGGPGKDLEDLRALLEEYGRNLDFQPCFADFERELSGLPGDCVAPQGGLWLARVKGQAAGCVALRPLGDGAGELRRLFVRPAFRHVGLGRTLAQKACDEARRAGLRVLRLETLPAMREATALYRSLGFQEIPPYREGPGAGGLSLQRAL